MRDLRLVCGNDMTYEPQWPVSITSSGYGIYSDGRFDKFMEPVQLLKRMKQLLDVRASS
jgi:hypothetical protein